MVVAMKLLHIVQLILEPIQLPLLQMVETTMELQEQQLVRHMRLVQWLSVITLMVYLLLRLIKHTVVALHP